MKDYQRVIAAVDLGELSALVVARAAEIARRYGASLTVVHVTASLPPFDLGGELVLPPYAEIEQAMVKSAQAHLNDLAKKFDVDSWRTIVTTGSPRAEILRIAHEHNADLVVVGKRSRRGVGLLMGSTANAILNAASCDVLAVAE